MKTNLKKIMLLLTLVLTFAACSSDDDKKPSDSRDVKYEITGNYTGTLEVTYAEKSGAPSREDISKLPWTKELTANDDSTAASVQVGGYGGTKGQTVTAKIYIGEKVVSELTQTATNDGIIVVAPNPYIFSK